MPWGLARVVALTRDDTRASALPLLVTTTAMTGDGCVAIASDLRFGVQNQTNACDMPKVFKMHDHLYVGLAGLATDMQTLCVCRQEHATCGRGPATCGVGGLPDET